MPFSAVGKRLPNRMVFFFREALVETIGIVAVERLWRSSGAPEACLPPATDDLEKAIDFSCFSALCSAVAEMYGEAGAQAILARAGRAAFSRTLRSTVAMVGLDSPPLPASLERPGIAEGLLFELRLLGKVSDMACSMEIAPPSCRIRITACPECAGRMGAGRVCWGVSGMLRGALDRLGFHPAVPVVEDECMACGAEACSFSVTQGF